MKGHYRDFLIRDWQNRDCAPAANIISSVLAEYHLRKPSADKDVLRRRVLLVTWGVWVIEHHNQLVGTGALPREAWGKAVEIRKMYLCQVPGIWTRYLLQQQGSPERFSANSETASILIEAVGYNESSGYQPAVGNSKVRSRLC